jgi:hypothetical protein
MSPEVFNNEDVTAAADVYALGCVLYEMLTGHMLVEGKSTAAIIGAHLKGIAIDEPLPEGTPPGTRELIQISLAKEPRDRYPSAAELAGELQRISSDRLTTPYAQLEQALTGQDWAEALALAIDIRAQDPNYRDVVALEARAQQGHWSNQWRSAAQQALEDEDYDAARGALSQWRRVDPANPDIEQLEQELALAEQYAALQALVSAADWEAAQTAADKIYAQEPSFRDIAALQAMIRTNLTPPQPLDVAGGKPDQEAIDAADEQATAVEAALTAAAAETVVEQPIDTTAEQAGTPPEEPQSVKLSAKEEADPSQAIAPAEDQPDPLPSAQDMERPTRDRILAVVLNPILLTAAVWALSSLFLLEPVYFFIVDHGFRKHFISEAPTEVALRLLIFGFIAGLGTGLILWINDRSLRWLYLLSIAGAWSLAFLLALIIPVVSYATSEVSYTFLASIQLMVAGILGGAWMVYILRRNGFGSSPKQMAFIIAGWGVALFTWNLLIFLPEYLARNGLIHTSTAFKLAILIAGAVTGAIGSTVMYRQLKEHFLNTPPA